MISHLTGGNTMQPPEPVLSRAEWERRYCPVPIRSDRRLYGSPPQVICPACFGPMREVPGLDDYCPGCRIREELHVERETVAAEEARILNWLRSTGNDAHDV